MYRYLKDSLFLQTLAESHSTEQFIKIIILNNLEKPIKEVQGKITGGNLSIDGSSSVRRTGNLSVYVDERTNDLSDIDHLFSINKRVKIEIGFINFTNYYKEYDMLWFPLGVYLIFNPNISHSLTGVNISLSLKDKMCLLNGECGGVFSASVILHEYDTINPETGDYINSKPTIVQIIRELVNHWGGEQLGKIIINDLDTRVRKVMKWTGSNPLRLFNNEGSYSFTCQSGAAGDLVAAYERGMDVGYIYTDFTYPGELIADAGTSVVDALDSIKSVLGNYEYFYDLEGNFIFQEIKNYLNTSKATVDLNNINNSDYLVSRGGNKAAYKFSNANLITSFSNTPQYQMIKNDFVVWGERESIDGLKMPIRYHLAIDKKPKIGNTYSCFFYEDEEDNIKKACVALDFDTTEDFPEKGQIGRFYFDRANNKIYKWDGQIQDYIELNVEVKQIITTDWRTELYLSGIMTERFGNHSNYYYSELANEWPKLYDVEGGRFYDSTIQEPSDIDFYLDFIDSEASVSELSVANIGRRTKVINDNKINCVFERDIPNFILIEAGPDAEQKREECRIKGQSYIQVESSIYSQLATGGTANSAFNAIQDLLYQHTSYNESISIQAMPVYFLEPNIRIEVLDSESGIKGDYIIKSISLPLDISGTMSISATRALDRI